MPRTTPNVPPIGSSRTQQVNYYAGFLGQLPGTYQGNYHQYVGKTWKELYLAIAADNPKANPKDLADAVLGLEAAQRTGTNIQSASDTLGKFVAASDRAVSTTNFAAGIPNPIAGLLAPLSEFAAVLNAGFRQVTKVSMWRSLGWAILGGILIILGIVWWAKKEGVPLTPKGVISRG